jgi:hypothetical protein
MANSTQDKSNAPFEWLTNFASLQHLLLPSRIVFDPASALPSKDTEEQPSDEVSGTNTLKLNALHVGCGTSTVGESLLLLRENVTVSDASSDVQRYTTQYGHVVNVDIDHSALNSMQLRWKGRAPDNTEVGEMDWRYIDFSREDKCREALGSFHQPGGGFFDLVLDKSTFDCLLCAESEAVTGLLCEVYHALRVPPMTNEERMTPFQLGGLYVLVTFHPVNFVREMLTNLPGAQWSVHHEIVRRQVEDVGIDAERATNVSFEEINTRYDRATNCITSSGIRNDEELTDETNYQVTKSAWSSGRFEPDENYRRTISVFTCRKLHTNSPAQRNTLDREEVRRHVEQCCNEHYKTTNPMVTTEREQEISLAFAKFTTVGPGTLDIRQCYDILFTDAEKEHLEYEYFLEDWHAYCENHTDVTARDSMTLNVALDFLREMQ